MQNRISRLNVNIDRLDTGKKAESDWLWMEHSYPFAARHCKLLHMCSKLDLNPQQEMKNNRNIFLQE